MSSLQTKNHEDLKAKYHELQNFVGKITQEKDEVFITRWMRNMN